MLIGLALTLASARQGAVHRATALAVTTNPALRQALAGIWVADTELLSTAVAAELNPPRTSIPGRSPRPPE